MDPAEVVSFIEGEPLVSAVLVDPGMTNRRLRNKGEKIIINIEAQKDEPAKYHILNRATFYVCRMISSQKEREFVKSEYNEIKQVYSIWICMNRKKNSLEHCCRRLLGLRKR